MYLKKSGHDEGYILRPNSTEKLTNSENNKGLFVLEGVFQFRFYSAELSLEILLRLPCYEGE